ncbi:hypothetical protein CW304_14855 [Bacillus sp. UFRGS-B20]|nr:hypothetical protein CW304_14855 [Bacillus sp. UFRGS-B20]
MCSLLSLYQFLYRKACFFTFLSLNKFINKKKECTKNPYSVKWTFVNAFYHHQKYDDEPI